VAGTKGEQVVGGKEANAKTGTGNTRKLKGHSKHDSLGEGNIGFAAGDFRRTQDGIKYTSGTGNQ